jgi:hypothetical protein
MSGNEASAIGSLRAVNSAESTFSSSCGQGNYAGTLVVLGTAPGGGGQAFISPDLGAADPTVKSGYTVALAAQGAAIGGTTISCNGGAAVYPGYAGNADAISTSTGTRHFATDNRGTIFFDNAAAIAQPIPAATLPIQ